ncbi:hypothetical protein PVAP13_2NG133515 [Panicum virgatum]|uniref:Uncharacterized protein n=1 Tax=Panicum virgatum TaxID=38727 RepID=A0A8T0VEU4_PANVG|nr:hypothetical protein PVAP13_2NG133515 [Panicum virgatum]
MHGGRWEGRWRWRTPPPSRAGPPGRTRRCPRRGGAPPATRVAGRLEVEEEDALHSASAWRVAPRPSARAVSSSPMSPRAMTLAAAAAAESAAAATDSAAAVADLRLRSSSPAQTSGGVELHGRRGRAPLPLTGGVELRSPWPAGSSSPWPAGSSSAPPRRRGRPPHGWLGRAPLPWPAGSSSAPNGRPRTTASTTTPVPGDRFAATGGGCGARGEAAGDGQCRRCARVGRQRGAAAQTAALEAHGTELLHLQLEPAGVGLLAGDAVLGADGGEGAADREARQQEVAMGIGGGMGKEESVG